MIAHMDGSTVIGAGVRWSIEHIGWLSWYCSASQLFEARQRKRDRSMNTIVMECKDITVVINNDLNLFLPSLK